MLGMKTQIKPSIAENIFKVTLSNLKKMKREDEGKERRGVTAKEKTIVSA